MSGQSPASPALFPFWVGGDRANYELSKQYVRGASCELIYSAGSAADKWRIIQL